MVQMTQIHSDRRLGKRFGVSLPVKTDRGSGVTRDVSISGLYLVTNERLVTGDRLRLVVEVPDVDRSFVRLGLKGRVVRVEDVDGAVGAAIAVDEESRSLLRAS